jgi:hypothetical protein
MDNSVFKNSEEILRLLALQNPDKNYGRAAEFLGQLNKLSSKEIGNLEQRMDLVRAIAASKICKIAGNLKIFLIEAGESSTLQKILPLKGNWIDRIVKSEAKAWKNFAGFEISKDKFAEALDKLGKERAEFLRACGFEFTILPKAILTQNTNIHDYKLLPMGFWEDLYKGKIYTPNSTGLVKVIEVRFSDDPIIFDRRCKPIYNDGCQRWENDFFMEHVIEKLQKEKKLSGLDCCETGSRFGLTRLDYDKLATNFGLALDLPNIFRLESIWEWNFLSQYRKDLPRAKDNQTSTWVWLNEFFEDQSKSFFGGSRYYGGFSDVHYHNSGISWENRSARLLGNLSYLVT